MLMDYVTRIGHLIKARKLSRAACILTMLLYTGVLYIFLSMWYSPDAVDTCDHVTIRSPYGCLPINFNVDHRRRLVDDIDDVIASVTSLAAENRTLSWRSELQLLQVINQLNPQQYNKVVSASNDPRNNSTPVDACEEVYVGYNGGSQPWIEKNCTHVRPLHKILSILFNFCHTNKAGIQQIQKLLRDLRATYRNVPLLVFTCRPTDVATLSLTGATVLYADDVTEGGAWGRGWSQLAAAVRTRYALLARDVTYFAAADWRLRRLISTLILSPQAAIAAGSSLNSSGHWRAGCWQGSVFNDRWTRRSGFLLSAHECMLCDSVDGPFVVRSTVIKDLAVFNESQPAAFHNVTDELLWVDWFQRVKRLGWVTLMCPDSMFDVTSTTPALLPHSSQWRYLARKWKISSFHAADSNSPPMHFSCVELAVNCSKPAVPHTCCLQPVCQLFRLVQRLLERHRLRHQLSAASTWSAVQLGAPQLPQPTAELLVEPGGLQLLHQNKQQLLKAGVQLSIDAEGIPAVLVARYAETELYVTVSNVFSQQNFRPWLLKFCGVWVSVERNLLIEILRGKNETLALGKVESSYYDEFTHRAYIEDSISK